jgi:hypothetical protein
MASLAVSARGVYADVRRWRSNGHAHGDRYAPAGPTDQYAGPFEHALRDELSDTTAVGIHAYTNPGAYGKSRRRWDGDSDELDRRRTDARRPAANIAHRWPGWDRYDQAA